MTSRPRLSAVAIMKDEADNLPGLIASLQGVVDELVLVDDSSSDNSVEIARSAGDWVVVVAREMDPETGFAGQRNAGIEAASGDWLLHMDCDERLSTELASEISDTLPATSQNAFRYRRLNYFLNRPMRHGGWNSWNRPQLARRGCHRFEGRLHEQCVIEGGEGLTGQLRGRMLHLNDPDYAYRLEKSGRYVAMEAERLLASGDAVGPVTLAAAPAIEFVKKYIVKLGFLDGVPGLIAALHSASATFRVRALVWDAQNRVDRREIEKRLAQGEAVSKPAQSQRGEDKAL